MAWGRQGVSEKLAAEGAADPQKATRTKLSPSDRSLDLQTHNFCLGISAAGFLCVQVLVPHKITWKVNVVPRCDFSVDNEKKLPTSLTQSHLRTGCVSLRLQPPEDRTVSPSHWVSSIFPHKTPVSLKTELYEPLFSYRDSLGQGQGQGPGPGLSIKSTPLNRHQLGLLKQRHRAPGLVGKCQAPPWHGGGKG